MDADDFRERVDEVEVGLWRDAELARATPLEPPREWQPLRCVECGGISTKGRGWKAYLASFAPPDLCVLCPDCATRELTG